MDKALDWKWAATANEWIIVRCFVFLNKNLHKMLDLVLEQFSNCNWVIPIDIFDHMHSQEQKISYRIDTPIPLIHHRYHSLIEIPGDAILEVRDHLDHRQTWRCIQWGIQFYWRDSLLLNWKSQFDDRRQLRSYSPRESKRLFEELFGSSTYIDCVHSITRIQIRIGCKRRRDISNGNLEKQIILIRTIFLQNIPLVGYSFHCRKAWIHRNAYAQRIVR